MVEAATRVVTSLSNPPATPRARVKNPPCVMTSREIITMLSAMLTDAPAVFEAVIALSEGITRDPRLTQVVNALALTAGRRFTPKNPRFASPRPLMPVPRPLPRHKIATLAMKAKKRPPYMFAQVQGDHVQLYSAGMKPIDRAPLQFTAPSLMGTSGTNLANLPANSDGCPFQLLVFDINHLHARARRAFPNTPVLVVKQIQRVVLQQIEGHEEFFAFYFASQNLVRFRRDQFADSRHGWYIEKSIKGWDEHKRPLYADVDVPLAHVLTQILERYPGQVSRVVLGCGDKDQKTLCETIKAKGIPLDILVVAEADLSRELRLLADHVLLLYP